ncbi:MAG TPA: VCBS repeat-containing protein, partial [Vicinamibacterales bacterium]|nr:VCBS repeat-containing protein [Vicinamibacterales bacterium]
MSRLAWIVSSCCVLGAAAVAGQSAPTGVFTDVTAQSGVRFVHNNGAFGKKYLPETLGAGVVVLDVDGDGWQDLLFVNSMNWPGRPGAKSYPALYRNRQDGTFADVTRGSGLDVEIYGIGGAAADFDNDGKVDVYLTALGSSRLFRNVGGGKFVDVTASAGVASPGFATSALWFDYDNDGKLDLFVAHYVDWSIEKDLYCTLDGKSKSYCTPESYKGQSGTLYHNRGDGTFADVTRQAGLFDAASKALGVAMFDFDGDGWMDLFVANDTQPNRLYRNKGNGTFADVAVGAGVAFSEAGVARAGMGVDAADYDGSGRPSLVIGNFSNEMMALYHNEGTGLFIDEAPTSGIGRASLLTLTFGCFFFDYDLDGRLDLLS